MKKLSIAILCLLFVMLISLSACVNSLGQLPYGKWESHKPYILLDINPQNEEFLGICIQEEEQIDVLITFPFLWKEFDIYKLSDKDSLLEPDSYKLALFNGSYRIRGDKLHYKLKPYWQEKSGVTHTIVFTKIEEYEAPDPKDDPN